MTTKKSNKAVFKAAGITAAAVSGLTLANAHTALADEITPAPESQHAVTQDNAAIVTTPKLEESSSTTSPEQTKKTNNTEKTSVAQKETPAKAVTPVEQAQATVNEKQTVVDQAKADQQKVQNVYNTTAEQQKEAQNKANQTQNDVKTAQADVIQAQTNVSTAQNAVDQAQETVNAATPEAIAQADADVTQVQEQVNTAHANQEKAQEQVETATQNVTQAKSDEQQAKETHASETAKLETAQKDAKAAELALDTKTAEENVQKADANLKTAQTTLDAKTSEHASLVEQKQAAQTAQAQKETQQQNALADKTQKEKDAKDKKAATDAAQKVVIDAQNALNAAQKALNDASKANKATSIISVHLGAKGQAAKKEIQKYIEMAKNGASVDALAKQLDKFSNLISDGVPSAIVDKNFNLNYSGKTKNDNISFDSSNGYDKVFSQMNAEQLQEIQEVLAGGINATRDAFGISNLVGYVEINDDAKKIAKEMTGWSGDITQKATNLSNSTGVKLDLLLKLNRSDFEDWGLQGSGPASDRRLTMAQIKKIMLDFYVKSGVFGMAPSDFENPAAFIKSDATELIGKEILGITSFQLDAIKNGPVNSKFGVWATQFNKGGDRDRFRYAIIPDTPSSFTDETKFNKTVRSTPNLPVKVDNAKTKALQDKVNAEKGKVATASANLNAAKSAQASADKALSESTKTVEAITNELNRLKKQTADLTVKETNATKALTDAKSDVLVKENALKDAKATLEASKQDVAKKQEILKEKQATVQKQQALVDQTKAQLDTATAKVAEFESVLATAKTALEKAKTEVATAQKDLDAKKAYAHKLKDAPNVLKAAQETLENAKATLSEKQTVLSKAEDIYNGYKAIAESATSDLAKAKSLLDLANVRLEKATKDLNQAKDALVKEQNKIAIAEQVKREHQRLENQAHADKQGFHIENNKVVDAKGNIVKDWSVSNKGEMIDEYGNVIQEKKREDKAIATPTASAHAKALSNAKVLDETPKTYARRMETLHGKSLPETGETNAAGVTALGVLMATLGLAGVGMKKRKSSH